MKQILTSGGFLLFLSMVFLSTATRVFAVGGDLDTTFTAGVTQFGQTINTVAAQTDGRVLIGGNFTVVGGRSFNRLARLNTNGTVDQSFVVGTGFNTSVNAIAVQTDGRILVGGVFNNYNGTARSFLIRLNSDGSLDTTFNIGGTGPGNQVDAILIQPDGRILIAGFFAQYNGTTVGRVARLNFDGSLDTAFNANLGAGFNNITSAIALEADGQIIVGGSFTSLGAATANRVARLNADGTHDTAFLSNAGTGFNQFVNTVAVQADGRILVGGQFNSFNGTTRNRLARLNADGTLDANWASITIPTTVQRIVVQPDGQFLVTGENSATFGSGANQRQSIARLNAADGSIDPSFNLPTGVDGVSFRAISLQPDGSIFIGGNFTRAGSSTRSSVANLNADGSVNPNFAAIVGAAAQVNAVRVLADDRVLVGGNFRGVNESFRAGIARLYADGTTDTAFNAGAAIDVGSSGSVLAITVQPDGRILVSGGGTNNSGFRRLNADGSLDPTFNATVNLGINAIIVQSDGRILIGGLFNNVNGVSNVNRIARLNADGTTDTTFNIGTAFGGSGSVEDIALQPNGQIIIGGNFTVYNGTTVNRIARLNADGTLDTTFTANGGTSFNSSVEALELQTDGRILAGGFFTNFNGANINFIARLNADGTRDASFNVGTGFGGTVNNFALQTDGRIVCVGNFQTFNGITRRHLARLNTDGSLDASFRSGVEVNNILQTVALQADGRIIIGGALQNYDNIPKLGIARVSAGDTITWTGAAGFDWNTGANWSSGVVPTAADNAVIPSNFNVNLNGNASALTVSVGTNSILTISAGSVLTVEGGTNNGTIAGAGTLDFIGAAFGNSGTISVAAVNVNAGTGLNKALTGNGAFVGNLLTLSGNITLALQSDHQFHEINLQSGALFDATSRTVTLRGANALQGNGILVNNLGTIIFDSTTAQNIARSPSFNNLTVNNPAGITIGNLTSPFISGTLNLQNGIITLGTAAMIFDSNATVVRTNGYITGRITKRFFTTGLPAFTFPLGTANGYSPVTVEVTDGTTEISASVTQTNQPNLNAAVSLRRYWNLTSSNGAATANLTFNYLQTDVFGNENNYRITRVAGGVPQSFANSCANGSPCVDAANNTATIRRVSQFSDWTLSELAPTAANIFIGGRILTADGSGIARTSVTLITPNGETRFATTNSFGYYRFSGLPAGETYVVSVRHKRFEFSPDSTVVNAAENLSDLNFIANQEGEINSKE